MTKEKLLSKELTGGISPHIIDEYSRLKKVLVTPTPAVLTSFTDLVVNPIQEKALRGEENKGQVKIYEGAAERHGDLLTTLQHNGVELVFSKVTPIKEGHTPLFTRDVGVIIEDTFIPSRMNYSYRQVEIAGAIEHINPKHIYETDIPYKLEGGDIVYLEKDLLLVGLGPRTDVNGLDLLQSLFPDKLFVSFSTVRKDKAFHIDTNLGILGNKHLIFLPELVPTKIVTFLTNRGYTFVEAEPSEYDTCCTNVIALNDKKVIAPAENKTTNQRIRESGVEVIEIELKEILSFGGGPHCLTLPLIRE